MSRYFTVPPLGPVDVQIVVEPVYDTLMAMAILNQPEALATEPWLAEIAARLTPEEQRLNRIIFGPVAPSILPDKGYLAHGVRFTDYVDEFRKLKRVVREKKFGRLQRHFPSGGDPYRLIVNHLSTLWTRLFFPQWDRRVRQLTTMTAALNDRDWPTESAAAAVRGFLKRELPSKVSVHLEGVMSVRIVPSAYMHLQATRFKERSTLWVFVHGDSRSLPLRFEPIQRQEALGPIDALADETRLRILEMLSAFEELRAQEVIQRLGVSQSTVSRHLTQLRKAGFISERRGGDASKVYRLEKERLSDLYFTLDQLLTADNADLILNDIRTEYPAELRPFLNREAKLIDWSSKRGLEPLILTFLQAKFDPDRRYSEKEVNALLNRHHTFNDPAYLRRKLIEWRYLQRTPSGSAYWVSDEGESETRTET